MNEPIHERRSPNFDVSTLVEELATKGDSTGKAAACIAGALLELADNVASGLLAVAERIHEHGRRTY